MPLLKKYDLNKNDPANYKPISNLNTMSEILEPLGSVHTSRHHRVLILCTQPITDATQRKLHCSRSPTISMMTDTQRLTILAALHQSAAFDCINHPTMIRLFQHTFGVSCHALDWLTSYLQSRRSFDRLHGSSSAMSAVDNSVPRGSSLGPLLFSLYIAPLSALFWPLGVTYHQYAPTYVRSSVQEVRV